MTLEARKREVAAMLAELVDWLAEAEPDESRLRTARVVVEGSAAYLRDDVAERSRPVLRLVKRDDDQPESEAA